MIINIYKIGCKEKIIDNMKVNKIYDSYYNKKVPTISAKRCRDILNSLYGKNFKIDSQLFVFENVETGCKSLQELYRNGTILNF